MESEDRRSRGRVKEGEETLTSHCLPEDRGRGMSQGMGASVEAENDKDTGHRFTPRGNMARPPLILAQEDAS